MCIQKRVLVGAPPFLQTLHAVPLLEFCFLTIVAGSSAVADTTRSNLSDFGRYVQEMLPKYVQQTQITFR